MRRTLGTDLQGHGTMKDAQQILLHASIKNSRDLHAGNSGERALGPSTHGRARFSASVRMN
jgi:hypothetical protein